MAGVYTMPFVTIEDADVLNASRIIVGNDKNPLFSADRADDTKFAVLEVPDLIAAK